MPRRGERRVDVERLCAIFRDCRWRKCSVAHVVEAVGELDHDHAQSRAIAMSILRKFSACRSSRDENAELADLRHAVDELGDLLAELALEIRLRACVSSDDVVQEAGRHRGDVILKSTRRWATSSGWERYGSPDARC